MRVSKFGFVYDSVVSRKKIRIGSGSFELKILSAMALYVLSLASLYITIWSATVSLETLLSETPHSMRGPLCYSPSAYLCHQVPGPSLDLSSSLSFNLTSSTVSVVSSSPIVVMLVVVGVSVTC